MNFVKISRIYIIGSVAGRITYKNEGATSTDGSQQPHVNREQHLSRVRVRILNRRDYQPIDDVITTRESKFSAVLQVQMAAEIVTSSAAARTLNGVSSGLSSFSSTKVGRWPP